MIRSLFLLLPLALTSTVAIDTHVHGVLGSAFGGTDFRYHSALSKSGSILTRGREEIGSGDVELHARLLWGYKDTSTSVVDGIEHAIVAYTQGERQDITNASGQGLWENGVGAFLDHKGLNIELWYWHADTANPRSAGPRAYVWSQMNNGCQIHVNGPDLQNPLCLSFTPNGTSYITLAPGFKLHKGVYYWVRIRLSHLAGDFENIVLHADLLQEHEGNAVLVQEAAIRFRHEDFLDLNKGLRASFARTSNFASYPFPENIYYWGSAR